MPTVMTAKPATALQLDHLGHIRDVSGPLLAGLDAPALLGQPITAALDPASLDDATALLDAAYTGQPAWAVLRFRTGLLCDVVSTPLFTPDGPAGAWWTLRPHAERHGPAALLAQHLLTLLSNLPGVATYLLHLRPPRRVLAASPALADWLGQPLEALADPHAWSRLVHHDDLPRLVAAGWQTAQAATPFDQRYRLLPADGMPRLVRELAVTLPGDDGEPGLWWGILIDQSASSLLTFATATTPETLLDLIPTGLLASDAAGQVVVANQAFSLLLNLPAPSAMSGQPLAALADALASRCLDPAAFRAWLAAPTATPTTFPGTAGLTLEALALPSGMVVLARPDTTAPCWQALDTLLAELPVSLFVALGLPGSGSDALRLLYLSPYAARQLGHDGSACLDPTAVAQAIDPDDLARLAREVGRPAATATPYQTELRVRGPDGQTRWLAVKAVRLPGPLPLWVGCLTDVTTERTALMALAERTALLHGIITASPNALLFVDREQRIQHVNPAFCQLFDLPNPEAVIGQRWLDLADALRFRFADPAGFVAGVAQRLADGVPVRNEELRLADGRILSRDVVPVDGPTGRIGTLWRHSDITALRLAEEQLRELVMHLPAALVVVSTERQILPDGTPAYHSPIITPQIEALTGYTPAEYDAPGRWFRSLHPDDRDWVVATINAAHDADTPVRIDYRLVRKDGRVIWVRHEETSGYLPGLPGRCRIALLSDVTAQKQAEAALREAHDQLRQLIEQLPAALVVFLPASSTAGDGQPGLPSVIMSAHVAEVTGYPLEEWNQPGAWERALHPDDHDWVVATVREADAAHAPLRIEYRIRTPDGSVRWLRHEETSVCLPNYSEPIRIALAFDITDQKATEAALREAEARYRTLVEQLPAAVLVVERQPTIQPDGVPGWRVQYMSPKVAEITGYPLEEVHKPGAWARMLHPDDRERVLRQFLEAEEQEQPFHAVYRIIRKDGRIAWIRHEAVLVRSNGGPPVWQELLLDITAEQAAAEALHLAELRFQAFVEQQPGALLVLGPEPQQTEDGLPGWETLYVSPQIEAITGIPLAEWQQLGIWARNLHPDDRARVLAALVEAEQAGQPFRADYRFRHRTRGWVWIRHESTAVRDADGRLRYYQWLLLDVTAEREAVDALRELQARYRLLLETAPVVVYLAPAVEVEATTYVSPQVEALLGYTPEEWLAMPRAWVRHVHPDDLPAAVETIHAAAAAGQPFTITYRMIRRDGRVIWVQDRGMPQRAADGTAVIHGVMFDVTAQKQAEEALREAEARYRTLVEQLPGALIVADAEPEWDASGLPHFHAHYISPQIEALTGYTPEEWITPGIWARRLHPSDRPRVLRTIAAHTGGSPLHLEYRLVRKDGRAIWVRQITHWVPRDGGRALRHTILFDITAEKEAELQREAIEQRYRLLVEQIPAALFLADARDPLRLLYISPYIEAVTGYPPEAWQAEEGLLAQIVHQADLPHFTAAWSHAIQTGDRFQCEFRFRHARGHDVWAYGDAFLVRDQRGLPLYWHGLFLDITERKRSEQLLLGQSMVLSRIVQQAPLSEVLEAICRIIELQRPGVRASILLVDEHGQLRHGAGPSLPPDYLRAIDGLVIAPTGSGTCGRAAAIGEPVVTVDIETDPNWADYRELARQYGLRACWSIPVRSSTGHVLATVALYAGEPRQPDTDTWRLLELAAQLCALAIERWQADEQLRFQALHDPLTGLANRTLFYDRLEHAMEHAIREGHALAVAFIDLDRFKDVNDTYGHQAGDELLVTIAERLRRSVRASDTVARFAGDEFTVLFERLDDPAEIHTLAERLLDALRQPIPLSVGTVQISGSIGVAISTPPHNRGDLLLAADQALYAAKRSGRNRIVLAP
jgi:diguanylate cyclase (GGDEF)-like protein/PAS domain S-box-containing protein